MPRARSAYGDALRPLTPLPTKGFWRVHCISSALGVLVPHLVICSATSRRVYFQQDGASVHTAADTMNWMRRNNIKLLNDGIWPANSPDINIIEQLWPMVNRHLENCVYSSVEALWDAVQTGFGQITQNQVKQLYGSVQRRLAAVAMANGAHTKY